MSSSDLPGPDDAARRKPAISRPVADGFLANPSDSLRGEHLLCDDCEGKQPDARPYAPKDRDRDEGEQADEEGQRQDGCPRASRQAIGLRRSDEHMTELQSLMRISYRVFCLTKKNEKMSNSMNR